MWLGPLGAGLEPRVDFSDRLVAELEEVRVEEREVVVRLVRAGHVPPDLTAVALRVVLVLDPELAAEVARREARHVAGCEYVVVARDAAPVVDGDPVVGR